MAIILLQLLLVRSFHADSLEVMLCVSPVNALQLQIDATLSWLISARHTQCTIHRDHATFNSLQFHMIPELRRHCFGRRPGLPLAGEGLVNKGACCNGAHACQIQVVAELCNVCCFLGEVSLIQHGCPVFTCSGMSLCAAA